MRNQINRWMLLSLLCSAIAVAADKPLASTIDASACVHPPQIDGVIKLEEWKDAKVYPCAVTFVRIDPVLSESRTCELRVMNSANAMYVALKVPDATVHESLSPLTLDAAILAFSKDAKLAANTDRKVVAPGLYRDKFFQGAVA